MLAALEELRPLVEVPAARGAFYVLAKVAAEADSMEVAARLIRDHRVAAVPGAAFGLTAGCYLRIAYAAPDDATLAEALRRLTEASVRSPRPVSSSPARSDRSRSTDSIKQHLSHDVQRGYLRMYEWGCMEPRSFP